MTDRPRPSFTCSMLMPPTPEPGMLLRITGLTPGQTYLVEPVPDSLVAAWGEVIAWARAFIDDGGIDGGLAGVHQGLIVDALAALDKAEAGATCLEARHV